jgi:hypothetical protein
MFSHTLQKYKHTLATISAHSRGRKYWSFVLLLVVAVDILKILALSQTVRIKRRLDKSRKKVYGIFSFHGVVVEGGCNLIPSVTGSNPSLAPFCFQK